MGIKVNTIGLTGLYAKVGQVNVQNKLQTTTDDEGVTTNLTTCPMAVMVHLYSDSSKEHKVGVEEHHLSYDPQADDKNPVNQAYALIKSLYDVVEDPA